MSDNKKHYPLNRLLVALDTSEMDEVLMRTAAQMTERFPIQKIYFLYVSRRLELPEEVLNKYPDLAPADETVEYNLKERWKQHAPSNSNLEVEIEAVEGNPVDRLLRWVKTKKIDLLMMGRKTNLKGSGSIPNKLVKVAPCSILFVPENISNTFKRILVPIDYSEHSRFALEKGVQLGKSCDATLICQNVFVIPSGYHTTGKSREEFSEIMKENAEREYQHFMSSVDLEGVSTEVIFEENDDNDPADEIYNRALDSKADLIILGSKGRKGLSSLLLGSVASRVLEFAKSVPVLVVKEKDEGLSFLQALLRL